MKKIVTYGMTLILIFFSLHALNAQQRVERVVNKDFKAGSDISLEVDSKFGDVEILSWDKKEVSVVATMWVESSKESNAKEILDQLDVEIGQSGNSIYVRSKHPDKTNYGKNTKVQIDFSITAPSSMNMLLNSKYGSIYIEENTGQVVLNVKYGNAKIGTLSRGKEKPLNEINLAYSNASVEEMGWVKMNLAYSKATIEEARAIVMISKYSGLTVEECSSFVVEGKYDNYKFAELVNFNGEMKYSNLKVDELEKKLEFKGAYSNASVKEMGENFDLILIDASRGGVKVGLHPNSSFTFKGTARYGDLYVDGLDITMKKVDGQTKILEGARGKDPSARIEVKTNYLNAKFYNQD